MSLECVKMLQSYDVAQRTLKELLALQYPATFVLGRWTRRGKRVVYKSWVALRGCIREWLGA